MHIRIYSGFQSECSPYFHPCLGYQADRHLQVGPENKVLPMSDTQQSDSRCTLELFLHVRSLAPAQTHLASGRSARSLCAVESRRTLGDKKKHAGAQTLTQYDLMNPIKTDVPSSQSSQVGRPYHSDQVTPKKRCVMVNTDLQYIHCCKNAMGQE